MDAYIAYRDNTKQSSPECPITCNANKKLYYSCVIEKKTELSKTLQNFSSYNGLVRNIENECFEGNSLDSCLTFFNRYDLRY
jgi:hypothetical protein